MNVHNEYILASTFIDLGDEASEELYGWTKNSMSRNRWCALNIKLQVRPSDPNEIYSGQFRQLLVNDILESDSEVKPPASVVPIPPSLDEMASRWKIYCCRGLGWRMSGEAASRHVDHCAALTYTVLLIYYCKWILFSLWKTYHELVKMLVNY